MALKLINIFLLILISINSSAETATTDCKTQAKNSQAYGKCLILKADLENRGIIGETSRLAIKITNSQGDTITRKMISKILEGDSITEGDKSIIEFVTPKDVAGTRMLTHTHIVKNDSQWIFLPAANRTTRIASRNKKGSFMGSEFSYEDLSSQEVENYSYNFQNETTLDYEGQKRKVWVIKRVRLDKKTLQPDRNSGYSREVVYLDPEYNNPLRIDYYDKKNELLKTSDFKNFKKLNNKWWLPHEIHIKNPQTQKESVLTWTSRDILQKHKSGLFNHTKLNIQSL